MIYGSISCLNLCYFLKIAMTGFDFLYFHIIIFLIALISSTKNSYSDFDWDCARSINQSGEHWLLYNNIFQTVNIIYPSIYLCLSYFHSIILYALQCTSIAYLSLDIFLVIWFLYEFLYVKIFMYLVYRKIIFMLTLCPSSLLNLVIVCP